MFGSSSPTLRRAALTVAAAAALALVSPSSAAAQPTTPYTAPSGTGTSCTAAAPCSVPAAQAAVRSLNATMSDDIVVKLAGGVWRQVP